MGACVAPRDACRTPGKGPSVRGAHTCRVLGHAAPLEQAGREASHDESSSCATPSASTAQIRGNNAGADGEQPVWREGRWGWERHGRASQGSGDARLPLAVRELLAGGVAKTTPSRTLLAMPLRDLLHAATAVGAHTRVSAVAGDPGLRPHATTWPVHHTPQYGPLARGRLRAGIGKVTEEGGRAEREGGAEEEEERAQYMPRIQPGVRHEGRSKINFG